MNTSLTDDTNTFNPADNTSFHLSRLHMESFGRFTQRTIEGFQPGLNIVFGPNEAGKTTSVALVRQVLYGWARKDRLGRFNNYQPTTQERSGSLFFSSDQGEWELKRQHVTTKVLTHQGKEWPSAFEDLCGGISAETYKSVFSFDSEELVALEDSNDIATKLLTAGSSTQQAPTVALARINDEIASLISRQSGQAEALGTLQIAIRSLKEEEQLCEDQARRLYDDRYELVQLQQELEACEKLSYEEEKKLRSMRTDHDEATRLIREIAALEQERLELARSHMLIAKRAQENTLSPAEQKLLSGASRVTAANAQSARLQSLFDRTADRKLEFEEEQSRFASVALTGCRTDDSFKEMLEERRAARLALLESVRQAEEHLQNARAKAAEYDAIEEFQNTLPAGTQTNKLGVGIGVVIAVLGIVIALISLRAVGAVSLTVGNPFFLTLVAGLVMIASGALFIFLSLPKKKAREREVLVLTQRQLKEAVLSEEARLGSSLDAARKSLKLFDEETHIILIVNQLDFDVTSIEAAIKLVQKEEAGQAIKAACAIKLKRYQETQGEFVKLLKELRTNLKDIDPSINKAKDFEVASYVQNLYAQLLIVQEKKSQSAAALREAQSLEAQKKTLKKTIEEHRKKLDAIFARSACKPREDVVSILASRIVQSEEKVQKLKNKTSALTHRQGELAALLDAGAQETRLQIVREKLEVKKALQARSAQRYAQLLAAKFLLEAAIDQWSHVRQPEVYRVAGVLMSQMTNGRWQAVMPQEKGLTVTDSSYRSITPEKLSRGTSQQLYLALRIALLLEAEEIGRGLPVLADDILINFDAQRREEAAHCLAILAEHRQVILLTCHATTQELLARVCPQATTIRLSAS